jgi:hypothetical protein
MWCALHTLDCEYATGWVCRDSNIRNGLFSPESLNKILRQSSLLFIGTVSGLKRKWHEFDPLLPFSANVKNMWSYTSTRVVCLHDVDRDIFIFTLVYVPSSLQLRSIQIYVLFRNFLSHNFIPVGYNVSNLYSKRKLIGILAEFS